ncbi:MAG: S9 family peptidase, partial [Pseudomonadota bacterium]
MAPAKPPLAARKPFRHPAHGGWRDDPWHWLRDDSRTDEAVLDHLSAENRYTEAALAPLAGLRRTLEQELIGRVIRDDESVPYRRGPFEYFTRVSGDLEYPVFLRRSLQPNAPEQVILDCNQRAQGHPYYELGDLACSDDHRWLAITEDRLGRGLYALTLLDLETGGEVDPKIEGIDDGVAWSADGRYLFYVKKDPETLLPNEVWRHRLGRPAATDQLCRREADPAFYTSVSRGTSREYLYIHHGSTLSDEVWWLAADEPEAAFQLFAPRRAGHEYGVDDRDGRFFVHSNLRHENFELFEAERSAFSTPEQWQPLIVAHDQVLLEDFALMESRVVVAERRDGLPALRVHPLDGESPWVVTIDGLQPAEQPCYFLDDNGLDQPELRLGVTSLTRPYEIYDLDLASRRTQRRKRTQVGGGYDPAGYASERHQIRAADGSSIPVSLVYRKAPEALAERPLLVYGYGAYGSCIDPEFSASRLSLLDRGVIFAIAHVRGGEDLGRHWYHAGRREHKTNTFSDFIDVLRGLAAAKIGDTSRVFAMGGSAGGLLVGAVLNQAPELLCGAIAQVPFVDVLTTMEDSGIPLTSGEYDEWGDPTDPVDYDRMALWSPYDNVSRQTYPHLLVTAGLHDGQVQYWEPAKWVAKLRAMKDGDRLLLLRTEMDAGHGGV